jgi:hypothetical protein
MLEATSYGLIAVGVILVAAFCFIWVEEKAALPANRSPRLVDGSKKNSFSSTGNQNLSRSSTGFAAREKLTGLDLFLQRASLACPRSPDENSPNREQKSSGVSRG